MKLASAFRAGTIAPRCTSLRKSRIAGDCLDVESNGIGVLTSTAIDTD
jgi:hypothetical protein